MNLCNIWLTSVHSIFVTSYPGPLEEVADISTQCLPTLLMDSLITNALCGWFRAWQNHPSLEQSMYNIMGILIIHVTYQTWSIFLPTPLAGAWVNRWTFSPPPLLLSHLQIFVSLRYRTFMLGTENAVGGHGSLTVYAILFSSHFSKFPPFLFFYFLNIYINSNRI